MHEVGILGVFRSRPAFKISNPWPQFHAQTSAKYPLGLLDISKIGPMSFTSVAFITGDIFFGFLGKQRQAGCERGESHTSDGGSAPRALHACFRSPEKREENNACDAGHHSWATIEGRIYEKKKLD